ncbi:MAG: ATP-binding protein [Anaerolineae bacterium]|nr:ATP-binding protein [Anaerolineae bacterium]
MEEGQQGAITSSVGGEGSIQDVPETVLTGMDQEIVEVGGEWTGNPEDEGALGWTAFDTPSSDDGTVTVLLPSDTILDLPHQSLVRIISRSDNRSYLGIVVSGPFTEPDGLRPDAPIVVTATVRGRGNILISKYHGRVQVELIGEELEGGGMGPPRRRPLPNSPVFALTNEETARILKTKGDIRLGIAESHEEIIVKIPTDKSVLPRHVGVLGTTGGGKSTTVSGMVNQLQNAGAACVILDTEGEYTAIHEPTNDPRMEQALTRLGLTPSGIENTHIYHLVGRETANPDHPDVIEFSLLFSEFSPHALGEILEFSQAQETRYFQAYDVCKALLRDFGVFPARNNRDEEREAQELDELETGFPRMTLSHIIDIASVFLHVVSHTDGDPRPFNRVFSDNLDRVMTRVRAVNPGNDISWRALLAKLWRLHRLRIFDSANVSPIDYANMLLPGRISIIDLSDTDSREVTNLVIAQILRGIQKQQEECYNAAIHSGDHPMLTMVFLEEAHEFLSAERIKQMPVLFQQVSRIARRGRKRWLGLTFITQLPQKLPDEALGLINSWVLHKISDANVVTRLRRSIGDIDEGLWRRLPNLAPGQAVVSFTSLSRPLLVAIDPTPCKLLMVE